MKKSPFKLHSPFKPAGSQPEAIKQLIEGRPKESGDAGRSTLIGVTGSGKTFTIANVIANQNKKVLILAPNKTLAAQLYEEFSVFFHGIGFFISVKKHFRFSVPCSAAHNLNQRTLIPQETFDIRIHNCN